MAFVFIRAASISLEASSLIMICFEATGWMDGSDIKLIPSLELTSRLRIELEITSPKSLTSNCNSELVKMNIPNLSYLVEHS
jgi:hypothetical protein